MSARSEAKKFFLKARKDYAVSLELRCADDFGAGYKSHADLTDEDRDHLAEYRRTREAHHRLAARAEEIGVVVDVSDSDDRDSRHGDAYVRFRLSQLPQVARLLDEVGIQGDTLDVPADLPQDIKRNIQRSFGWTVDVGSITPQRGARR